MLKNKSINQKRILTLLKVLLGALAVLVLLTGCIPGDGKASEDQPAGFFWGIWHGWLAPLSLIIGIFDKDIRIYEVLNKGWWYDLGYYIAIIGGFGGLSFTRKKSKEKKRRDRCGENTDEDGLPRYEEYQ